MLREIASTLPASGSVYTYSYATIGEFVAHLVGWSLLLIYIGQQQLSLLDGQAISTI